jgi:hypothetical protein
MRANIIYTIRDECEAEDGFLVNLREGRFLSNQYNDLIRALAAYRNIIRGEKLMEREVVACLYYLDLELRAAVNVFGNQPQFEEVKKAQLECSELILEIITPEFMLGSNRL